MGFALTIVYIIATIVSPEQMGPQWASYHALVYLAVLTFLFSVPNLLQGRRLRSSIQTFLLLAFIVAIAFSNIANGWAGGIVGSWQVFLPNAAVFFFIVANVTTAHRLKILALAAVASCLFVVVEALCGYYGGFQDGLFVLQQNIYLKDEVVGSISRLRGAGFLNDPNDLAQVLLITLPLLALAWQEGRKVANAVFVIVPAALMLWALYLTHSRGALVALAILLLMVARKKIGNTASIVMISALILGMLALDFTGGRGISAADGADRLEAWANGLEMFKSAPFFGVGFGRFTDFNEITAHNSFVLCLAELGLVGSTIWVSLLVVTMAGLNGISRNFASEQIEPAPAENVEWKEASAEGEFLPFPVDPLFDATASELAAGEAGGRTLPALPERIPGHWITAMVLSLIGFITTGWFLSRSYKAPLYLALGLATATIALQQRATNSRVRSHWISCTFAVEAAAILCIYCMVRL